MSLAVVGRKVIIKKENRKGRGKIANEGKEQKGEMGRGQLRAHRCFQNFAPVYNIFNNYYITTY